MRKVLEYQKLADDCRKRAAHAANQPAKEALQRLHGTSWRLRGTSRSKKVWSIPFLNLGLGRLNAMLFRRTTRLYLLTRIARRRARTSAAISRGCFLLCLPIVQDAPPTKAACCVNS